MRAWFAAVMATAGVAGCAASTADLPPVPQLEKAWVADGFSSPEGVAVAPDGSYFISNVGGEGETKDGDGYISKLSPDGTLIEPYFAAKLNDPKGMAVKDGVLYVADIDEVVTFDATTGERLAAIAAPESKFLNDVTVWNDTVYVSDSVTSRIYTISDGKAEVWLEDERLAGVNGLLPEGKHLLTVTMNSGTLYRISKGGSITPVALGMKDGDGIGIVPGGGHLVSAWPGEIFYVNPHGNETKLLDTTASGIFQNDLTMFGDTVVVPNWEPGTVTAWRVVR